MMINIVRQTTHRPNLTNYMQLNVNNISGVANGAFTLFRGWGRMEIDLS